MEYRNMNVLEQYAFSVRQMGMIFPIRMIEGNTQRLGPSS